MKKIYICGDSFCVPDAEYGPCWVDMLSNKRTVVNLAQVSATNLLISMQVDRAISESAQFIIFHSTSCTRCEARVQGNIVPYSFLNADTSIANFNNQQLQIIRDYYTEFFDLELSIYQNQCIIENTLQKLVNSKIPFRFDQGGFEHKAFGGTHKNYFDRFVNYRSQINLWDYSATRRFRPYYHITDQSVHRHVADYYIKETE